MCKLQKQLKKEPRTAHIYHKVSASRFLICATARAYVYVHATKRASTKESRTVQLPMCKFGRLEFHLALSV